MQFARVTFGLFKPVEVVLVLDDSLSSVAGLVARISEDAVAIGRKRSQVGGGTVANQKAGRVASAATELRSI
jgi:hypothetical protein